MNALLRTLQAEFNQKIQIVNSLIRREVALPDITSKIQVVIGMRRSGKTSFLLQTIADLLKQGIPLTRILYLNFEDDRLLPMDAKQFADFIEDFYSLYPENHEHKCYLFFDEIQNVSGWAQVVRRIFDTKKNQIFLSGSSAKLLSKEIASSLRGRAIATEMWPFNFREYLATHAYNIPEKPYSKMDSDHLKKLLLQYLCDGGFPEVMQFREMDQIRVLQDYVDVVIFRDIVERHNITNISLINYLIKHLLVHTASHFSINKFYNDLKSQGFKISRVTLHDYLAYIEDAFLAFSVPLYSSSLRKVQVNPQKIYAIDTGMVNAFTLERNRNIGHLLENLVYLDLRRRNYEIYYYLTAERYEVDFVVKTLDGKLKAYQVCADANDEKTLQREIRALKQAEKELKITGELITVDSYLQEFL